MPPGSSSAADDAFAAVVRTPRTGRVFGLAWQKGPLLNVAPQVYYAPLIILAGLIPPVLEHSGSGDQLKNVNDRAMAH